MAILGALSIDVGAKSLKNIDGTNLSQDDICIVIDTEGVYFYRLDVGFGTPVEIPYVVAPTQYAGDKR